MKSMLRGAAFALIALALSGCSWFGVATKGDLEKHIQAEQAERQQLADLLTRIRGDLGTTNTTLRELRADIETAQTDWSDTQARVASLDQSLVNVAGLLTELDTRLRTDLSGVRTDMDSVLTEVTQVGTDLDSLRGQAELASVRSEAALRTYYEGLMREREQVLEELEAVEDEIRSFTEVELVTDSGSEPRILP